MRNYLSLHPEAANGYSPEELDRLDALVKRAVEALHVTDQEDRIEVAARILSIYDLGTRTEDEIVDAVVRLHRMDCTPGGRRSACSRLEKQQRNAALR
jgi:hypothetical protein